MAARQRSMAGLAKRKGDAEKSSYFELFSFAAKYFTTGGAK
jgi:hypothetical protein